MSPRTTSALVLALALLAPFAAAQSKGLEAKVDAALKKHLESKRCVGLSIAVALGDELVAKGCGLAEAEFRVPANADTMFRIGSITKQFTSALVMRLVEQGKVSLDDPLSKHVPEFDTQGKVVTVRQLLDHTSGIKSYTDVGEEWEKSMPLELTHEQLLAIVKGKPFDFEPGTDWHYNNTGYYLLGMLIEKGYGKPYAKVVVDELAAPLGLTRTRYDDSKELIENRAQGYEVENGVVSNDPPLGMSQPGAAGGLLSTGKDLVAWAKALQGGKVVSTESFTAMTTSKVLPSGRNTQYGFGLVMEDFAGKQCIGHGGGINGFNSSLLWFPAEKCYVAAISNGGVSARRVAEDLAYAALGIERPKAADNAVPEDLAKKIVGKYRVDTIDMGIEILMQDGKLHAKGDGQSAFRILYQQDGEFRAAFDPAVKLVWSRDGATFALHQGGAVLEAKRTGD